MAAFYGRVATVQALLEHSADVSATTEKGLTALDWAQREGHTVVIAMLSGVSSPPPLLHLGIWASEGS